MGHESGLPDLVATHPDARSARATIERLSRAGVDGGLIRLLGRVEVVTAGRYGDRQTDLGSSRAVGGRVVRGVALGVPPGAAFGAVVLAVASEPTLAVVAAGLGGGALLGASVGALTGLIAIPTMASSWERTFAPMVPGGVTVGVRVTDRRCGERARRALAVAGVPVEEVADLDDLPDEPPDLHALDE